MAACAGLDLALLSVSAGAQPLTFRRCGGGDAGQ